jgi:hypothetical protein
VRLLSLSTLTLVAATLVAPAIARPGDVDPAFTVQCGVSGRLPPFADVLLAPDGRIVVVVIASPTNAVRFNGDGSIDASFASAGRVEVPDFTRNARARVTPDNRLVVASTSLFNFSVSRYLLHGRATTTTLRSSLNPAAAAQSVGLTATVIGQDPTGTVQFRQRNLVVINGCEAVPLSGGSATCAYGGAAAGMHTIKAIYSGDLSNPASQSLGLAQVVNAPGTETAIEYYHAGFDHYFLTTLPAEAASLDSGTTKGWQRTGRYFAVWPARTAGRATVCRFFGGQRFAPKSSHFYTPYATECANVKASADWMYEGDVFTLGLPDASGNCAAAERPLYRAFNPGQGAAPNDRYYAEATLHPEMDFRGWIAEGSASTRAFACLPGVSVDPD